MNAAISTATPTMVVPVTPIKVFKALKVDPPLIGGAGSVCHVHIDDAASLCVNG